MRILFFHWVFSLRDIIWFFSSDIIKDDMLKCLFLFFWVLQILIKLNAILFYPYIFYSRISNGRKTENSETDSDNFVQILLEQIQQFKQLKSQISAEHQQILKLAALPKLAG